MVSGWKGSRESDEGLPTFSPASHEMPQPICPFSPQPHEYTSTPFAPTARVWSAPEAICLISAPPCKVTRRGSAAFFSSAEYPR